MDTHRLTQVGRALRDLGIQMIPAYSPQARGRCERSFSTWQGRLPQELRLRRITTLDEANLFLREHYIQAFNNNFQVPAAQKGSAFIPRTGKDLDLIFSVQSERTVNRDNTVSIQNLTLQIEPLSWRATLAGCAITVHQHLDTPSASPTGLTDWDATALKVRSCNKQIRRRRLLAETNKPDISCATKTGHFNLLRTG